MQPNDNPSRTTRGRFLSIATVGVGGTIAGVAAAPAAAYLLAPTTQEATFRPVPLGPVSQFTASTAFPPTAAPYVEDPAQPITSAGLAYVMHTGHSGSDWLARDAM